MMVRKDGRGRWETVCSARGWYGVLSDGEMEHEWVLSLSQAHSRHSEAFQEETARAPESTRLRGCDTVSSNQVYIEVLLRHDTILLSES